MEFLDCDDLHNVIFDREIRSEHDLTLEKKVYISWQLCRGIEYLHANKVLHRDIKPKNVLLKRKQHLDSFKQSFVKICDFGVSACTELSESICTIMRSTRPSKTGTPLYMAPEIIQKKLQIFDWTVDIWSTTCTLYELFVEARVWNIKHTGPEELENLFRRRAIPDFSRIPEYFHDEFQRGLSYFAPARPTATELVDTFESYINKIIFKKKAE